MNQMAFTEVFLSVQIELNLINSSSPYVALQMLGYKKGFRLMAQQPSVSKHLVAVNSGFSTMKFIQKSGVGIFVDAICLLSVVSYRARTIPTLSRVSCGL